MSTQNKLAVQIESCLAGTQCRECGYHGCAPYAEAMANGEAEINLCRPGGEEVIVRLSVLLEKPVITPVQEPEQPLLAVIDESKCIGCTMCIKACPTDTIIGAPKQSHTVIAEDCTGCKLCITPCPVDCIDMLPTTWDKTPAQRSRHVHALVEAKQERLEERRQKRIQKTKNIETQRKLDGLLSADKLEKIKAARVKAAQKSANKGQR